LVVGERDEPEGVLIEQRLAGGHLAERPLPRRRDLRLADLQTNRATRLEGSDRLLEVGRAAAEADIAEAVDEDDRGLERAVRDGWCGEAQVDEVRRIKHLTDVRDRGSEGQVRADRREDVAAVE